MLKTICKETKKPPNPHANVGKGNFEGLMGDDQLIKLRGHKKLVI